MQCKALLHKACNQLGVKLGAIFPVFNQKTSIRRAKSNGKMRQGNEADMKRFSKERPLRQAAQQKAIYRRGDERIVI